VISYSKCGQRAKRGRLWVYTSFLSSGRRERKNRRIHRRRIRTAPTLWVKVLTLREDAAQEGKLNTSSARAEEGKPNSLRA